jgi:hypothetical protein
MAELKEEEERQKEFKKQKKVREVKEFVLMYGGTQGGGRMTERI